MLLWGGKSPDTAVVYGVLLRGNFMGDPGSWGWVPVRVPGGDWVSVRILGCTHFEASLVIEVVNSLLGVVGIVSFDVRLPDLVGTFVFGRECPLASVRDYLVVGRLGLGGGQIVLWEFPGYRAVVLTGGLALPVGIHGCRSVARSLVVVFPPAVVLREG